MNLARGGQFFGINKFQFDKGFTNKTELHINLTDKHIILESKLNNHLKKISINYLIIREKSKCKNNQVTRFDILTKK